MSPGKPLNPKVNRIPKNKSTIPAMIIILPKPSMIAPITVLALLICFAASFSQGQLVKIFNRVYFRSTMIIFAKMPSFKSL